VKLVVYFGEGILGEESLVTTQKRRRGKPQNMRTAETNVRRKKRRLAVAACPEDVPEEKKRDRGEILVSARSKRKEREWGRKGPDSSPD